MNNISLLAKFIKDTGSFVRSADVRSADVRSADVRSAYVRLADVRSADVRSADVRSADVRLADLRSADVFIASSTVSLIVLFSFSYSNNTSPFNQDFIAIFIFILFLKFKYTNFIRIQKPHFPFIPPKYNFPISQAD